MTHAAEQTSEKDVMARLAAIPERIARAVARWDAARLAAAPRAGEWPAQAILAHLRSANDILAPRAYMVLVRDNPPLPAYDERRWADIAGYERADFHTSLTRYAAYRAELVAALGRIAPDDWSRTGMHEVLGSVTLRELMYRLVEHDEEHAAQLESLAESTAGAG